MDMRWLLVFVFAGVCWMGCPAVKPDPGETKTEATADAGDKADSKATDTAAKDAGASDDAAKDTGANDAGTKDAGVADQGTSDSVLVDKGAKDDAPADAGPTDTGSTDTGVQDSTTDAGPVDQGTADQGTADVTPETKAELPMETMPKDTGGKTCPVPEDCKSIVAAFQAEMKNIQSCSSDADCGKVLTGTSCGCTRNRVARKNADLTCYNALRKVAQSKSCDLGLNSTCDCPPTNGYKCVQNICTWNYTNRP